MHNSFSIRRIGRYASCTQETHRNTKSQILHCAICELHWIMFLAGSCYSSHLERYHQVIPLWHEFDHDSCQNQTKQRTTSGRSLPQLSCLQAIDRQTATGFRTGLVEISNHAMVHVLSGWHPKLCKVIGISPHLAVLVVSVLLLLLTQKLGWDSIQRVWAQFLLLQGRMQKNNSCDAALEDLTFSKNMSFWITASISKLIRPSMLISIVSRPLKLLIRLRPQILRQQRVKTSCSSSESTLTSCNLGF